MPFVFLIIGIGLLVIAVEGTQGAAITLLKNEFVGPNSFVVWVIAIAILCSVGYVKPLRPIADAFVGLILIVLIVNKKTGNIFAMFNQQIRNPVTPNAPAGVTPAPIPSVTPGVANPYGVTPQTPMVY